MPVLRFINLIILHGQTDSLLQAHEVKVGEMVCQRGVRHAFPVLSISFRRVEDDLEIAELRSYAPSQIGD